MLIRLGLATALLLSLALVPAGARDEPKTKAKDKPAEAKVYDENADAKADVEKALRLAKKDNQRVLIQWGGNWCSWCILLNERFKKDADLNRELLYEYRVVHVDIGHNDKNLDLAKRFETTFAGGVPFLTVLDADGKVLKNQPTDTFETKNADGKEGKNGHDPKKLLAFLKEYEPAHLQAETVKQQGLDEAAKSDRLVFLHFGAPWCGWCHRLEDWMAKPEVAAILAKEFVDVKLDNDRMPGAKAILDGYNAKAGGIPWFAFVDSKGKALATSDDVEGKNIGFPSEPKEIEHFVKMLEMTHRKLTKADIELLATSLRAETKAHP